jgi:hypothetical protein
VVGYAVAVAVREITLEAAGFPNQKFERQAIAAREGGSDCFDEAREGAGVGRAGLALGRWSNGEPFEAWSG